MRRQVWADRFGGKLAGDVEKRVKDCLQIRDDRAGAAGIAPGLVATKADVTRLVLEGPAAKNEDHRLLQGWRLNLAGKPILGAVAAQSSDA